MTLRVGLEGMTADRVNAALESALMLGLIAVSAFVVTGVYRDSWRYASMRSLFPLIRTIGIVL